MEGLTHLCPLDAREGTPNMSEELEKLLAIAKAVKMTPAEQENQRRSFAYGNARIENDQITWDEINKAADSIPKPDNGTR